MEVLVITFAPLSNPGAGDRPPLAREYADACTHPDGAEGGCISDDKKRARRHENTLLLPF
eukprot:1390323-Amorphochlora_amoeboformis.AAC.1